MTAPEQTTATVSAVEPLAHKGGSPPLRLYTTDGRTWAVKYGSHAHYTAAKFAPDGAQHGPVTLTFNTRGEVIIIDPAPAESERPAYVIQVTFGPLDGATSTFLSLCEVEPTGLRPFSATPTGGKFNQRVPDPIWSYDMRKWGWRPTRNADWTHPDSEDWWMSAWWSISVEQIPEEDR